MSGKQFILLKFNLFQGLQKPIRKWKETNHEIQEQKFCDRK